MANYLIEAPHDKNEKACLTAIRVFMESGSHFLANASWGCRDNEHKAWLIVDVDTREQAIQILPPLYRKNAKITQLFQVTRKDLEHYKKEEKLLEVDKYH